jgi:sugar phosphate isomerase/epimerase
LTIRKRVLDPMKIKMAVNTVTIKPTPFVEKLSLISKAGFSGVGLWMDEIQDYLKGNSKEPIRELLEKENLTPVEMQLIRKWQFLKGSEQKEALEEARKFFVAFRELDIDCPVVLLPSEEEGNMRDGVRDFKRMCELAGEFGVNVMLEFLGWARQINRVEMAWEIVGGADCPNGGLLIDTFHFAKAGSRIEELRQIPMEKVFLVHLNDVKPLPMGIKEQSRGFRFFPGEGEAPLREIVQCFVKGGYKNYYCIEIFNESYWAENPMTILEKSKRSLESLF